MKTFKQFLAEDTDDFQSETKKEMKFYFNTSDFTNIPNDDGFTIKFKNGKFLLVNVIPQKSLIIKEGILNYSYSKKMYTATITIQNTKSFTVKGKMLLDICEEMEDVLKKLNESEEKQSEVILSPQNKKLVDKYKLGVKDRKLVRKDQFVNKVSLSKTIGMLAGIRSKPILDQLYFDDVDMVFKDRTFIPNALANKYTLDELVQMFINKWHG